MHSKRSIHHRLFLRWNGSQSLRKTGGKGGWVECVYPRTPILAARLRPFYNLHTRRPRIAHADAHTPNAYAPNTHIARLSEAYIVRIDRFTTPVATFACSAAPPHPQEHSRIDIN
jgi:hypothetical protein